MLASENGAGCKTKRRDGNDADSNLEEFEFEIWGTPVMKYPSSEVSKKIRI
jgi:hypothetical protein